MGETAKGTEPAATDVHQVLDLAITPEVQGAREYRKVSYPVRVGRFTEIESARHIYRFDRNGRIRQLRGKGADWPHPAEWLKRTEGGDWVYYSSGDYREVLDLTGEYYLPCLSYAGNPVAGTDPFGLEAVRVAIGSLGDLHRRLRGLLREAAVTGPLREALARIVRMDEPALAGRARRLHEILGGPVSVLPPDTRHVDYDVIPLVAADGCAFHCSFCCFRSPEPFRPRAPEDVRGQVRELRRLYGRQIGELGALFLGNHDALRAGADRIEFAARLAHGEFELGSAYRRGARLFLFGSADTLAAAGDELFRRIDRLPFETCVNVGLESPDPDTLSFLGKPLSAGCVRDAYRRMLEVNAACERVEVTANFVLGDALPASHLPALTELLSGTPGRTPPKGAVYLSPLLAGGGGGAGPEGARNPRPGGGGDPPEASRRAAPRDRRRLIRAFRDVKFRSRVPAYLYPVQRL